VQVVHTADLRILDSDGSTFLETGMATVGQLVGAELLIKHTRVWDTGKVNATLQSLSEPQISSADAPLEFIYELHANPDQWLIGGRRRVHFAAKVYTLSCKSADPRTDEPVGQPTTKVPHRPTSSTVRTPAPPHGRHQAFRSPADPGG
jgi:Trafficking protein particle complex subunit 10, TRAPPC10